MNVYSEATLALIRREERRRRFRRLRQGLLALVLLGVALWALDLHFADHRTFAWDEPVSIAVVALIDDDGSVREAQEWFVQDWLSRSAPAGGNLREVEQWTAAEFARWTGAEREILEVAVRGPLRLKTPPPVLPSADQPFLERLSGTRAFLGFFEELARRDELSLGRYDATIFVYFYDPSDAAREALFRRFDSLASRRNRLGVVFAPLSSSRRGAIGAVVAHELCHTLGASDKYDGAVSRFPEGFAEPRREPRYPQRKAEIMSLGVPLSPGVDEPATSLRHCVVGEASAREMRWPLARPQ